MQGRGPNQRKQGGRRSHDSSENRMSVCENRGVGRPLTGDLFYKPGEEQIRPPRPYKGCGLDNIFLLNGYAIKIYDGEEYMSVTDVDGLHKAIGRHLVLHRKGLAPKEIRFLRKTMQLTQAELAARLGNDAQSVARWEKGVCEMPGSAEKLLRAFFLAHNIVNENDDLLVLKRLIVSLLDELDSVDEAQPRQASFRLSNRWDEADKKAA